MQSKTHIHIIYVAFLLGLLWGCGDKWEKTGSTSVFIGMNDQATPLKIQSSSHLQFNKGTVLLHRIDFEGERKQSDDISIDRKYKGGIEINLSTGLADSSLDFQIPQGTYTELELIVRLKENEDYQQPSIIVKGTYNDNLPVQFEFNADLEFETEAEAEDGSSEIVIVKEEPTETWITLDPVYWFDPVTQNMLNNARLTEISGDSVLLINEETNENIYDLVAGRVDENSETVIK